MSDQFTRMELKTIRRYLSRVYPGVGGQDELWELIAKIDGLISKGKHAGKKNIGRGHPS